MENTPVKWTPDALRQLAYSAEQQAAIEAELSDLGASGSALKAEIVQRGEEVFAVSGAVAYKLLSFSDAMDERARWEYVPVIHDAALIVVAEEEDLRVLSERRSTEQVPTGNDFLGSLTFAPHPLDARIASAQQRVEAASAVIAQVIDAVNSLKQ